MRKQGHCLTPFQRKLLLKSLQTDLRTEYRRRIEIMLMADEGKSQAQICAKLGCSQETARYWISRAQAGEAHKWDDCLIGRPSTVNSEYLERLQELVNNSPREYGYPFERWTARWLSKHLEEELGIKVGERRIYQLLKKMGLSTRGNKDAKPTKEDSSSSEDASILIQDMNHDLQAAPPPDLLWSLDLIQTLN